MSVKLSCDNISFATMHLWGQSIFLSTGQWHHSMCDDTSLDIPRSHGDPASRTQLTAWIHVKQVHKKNIRASTAACSVFQRYNLSRPNVWRLGQYSAIRSSHLACHCSDFNINVFTFLNVVFFQAVAATQRTWLQVIRCWTVCLERKWRQFKSYCSALAWTNFVTKRQRTWSGWNWNRTVSWLKFWPSSYDVMFQSCVVDKPHCQQLIIG